MSVELVTGYYGVGEGGEPNRHVSSAEDGARQAGTLGLGCYALSTGSKLSATMEDANTLVVADGDVVMNGRHVSMPDATSFTIPTGVQGQKVSNLAVLRYQKAADSVESVTPVVLTGEPSTSTPTDPAHSEGSILDGDSPVDFPLYRVVTDGINAGDPEPLFDVLMPMADLWRSVSHYEGQYGWDIIEIGAARVCTYSSDIAIFADGNEYARFTDVPLPDGLFTEPPAVIAGKKQGDNTIVGVSVNMNVFSVSTDSVRVSINNGGGGIPENIRMPFTLLAVGW